MPVTQNDLDSLLDHSGHTFTMVVEQPDGSTRMYSGRNLAACVRDQDSRNNPYQVTDADDDLVYSCDSEGIVHVGNAEQLVADMHREKMMRAQIFTSATRQTIRYASKPLRG